MRFGWCICGYLHLTGYKLAIDSESGSWSVEESITIHLFRPDTHLARYGQTQQSPPANLSAFCLDTAEFHNFFPGKGLGRLLVPCL